MARYIDAEALMEELESLQVTVTGLRCGKGVLSEFIKEYRKSVLKIVHDQPTADVAPKSEVDKWYHEYHVIKDELKQERAYHRETEKLADRYFNELQMAKREFDERYIPLDNDDALSRIFDHYKKTVAREIFEEIEKFILTCIENDEKVFNSGEDEYYDGRFIRFKIIEERIAELKKKYTEEE